MVYCGRWYTYGTKSRFLTSPNADMLLNSPVYRILQTCARVMQRNARAAGFTHRKHTPHFAFPAQLGTSHGSTAVLDPCFGSHGHGSHGGRSSIRGCRVVCLRGGRRWEANCP